MSLDTNIVNKLKEASGSLTTFNGLLYGILFVTFIMVTLIALNIYFEFRHHLCAFSNVRKCVAGDKYCTTKKNIQNDKDFAVEYLTNQSISINLDLNNVTNQTLSVDYYKFDTTTQIIGNSTFSLDFNFTDSVPSTGVSNILGLGPSAGYNVNTNGVSIYLYPFEGKTITGVSASQIENIISLGMSASPEIAYIFEPLEGTVAGVVPNSGIVFVSDIVDYQFQLGTYILQNYANANPRNLGVTNSVTGVSSLFTNFSKNNVIPYQETVSDLKAVNITEIIKLNNYKSRQNCNSGTCVGCNCIDPVLEYIPNCKDYTYDPKTGDYTRISSKKGPPATEKVRFCSYLASSGAADGKSAIQINVPSAYTSIISKGKNVSYYSSGYDPNNPVKGPDVGSFKSQRYELESVFCSNTASLGGGYQPSKNKLYTSKANEGRYSLGTSAWNSKQPNGQIVGNTVNLGHPFR